MNNTNPFQLAKSVFDDVPIDFWAHIRTFLEYGHVLTDPDKYFCLAYPVDADNKVETWVVGSGGYVDAWYIHLFGGPGMAECYQKLLAINNLPRVCFYRWKNGERKHLRFYDRDKFFKMLERQDNG